MEHLPGVSKCYDQWLLLQGKVDSYYHDKPQKFVLLSKQKEFTQIKNAIIREAERLRLDELTFEEKNLSQYDEPEEFRNEAYDYWVIRDNSVPKSRPSGIQIDRKRLKKLQEKRMTLGHKPDDHEEQWPDLTM